MKKILLLFLILCSCEEQEIETETFYEKDGIKFFMTDSCLVMVDGNSRYNLTFEKYSVGLPLKIEATFKYSAGGNK